MGEQENAGTYRQKPIPMYLIRSAVEHAKRERCDYVVVRSDGDYQLARTLDEADTLVYNLESEVEILSPIDHSVQVISTKEAVDGE